MNQNKRQKVVVKGKNKEQLVLIATCGRAYN